MHMVAYAVNPKVAGQMTIGEVLAFLNEVPEETPVVLNGQPYDRVGDFSVHRPCYSDMTLRSYPSTVYHDVETLKSALNNALSVGYVEFNGSDNPVAENTNMWVELPEDSLALENMTYDATNNEVSLVTETLPASDWDE